MVWYPDWSYFFKYERQYLADASFSQQTPSPWLATNLPGAVSVTWINDPDAAKDGSSFLRVFVSLAGASVAQDVLAPQAGQSYSLSMWLRAVGTPVPVNLTLWALGGNQESASTVTTIGTDWTYVTVGLDVIEGGHIAMRAELYVGQAGATVDLDGSRLCNAGLRNASFSQQQVAWMANNLPEVVDMGWPNDPSGAKDGANFLRVHVRQAGASVAQDVQKAPAAGLSGYNLGMWLRAPFGSVPVQLTLWRLTGTQVSASTQAVLGTNWTFVTVGLDISHSDSELFRAELYVLQAGATVDLDGSRLWHAGLFDASFSSPDPTAWLPENLAASVHPSWIDDPQQAKDGSGFLRVLVDQNGGSIRQDDNNAPEGVGGYSLSAWLRALQGPVPIRLALWAWGDSVLTNDSTLAWIGTNWTLVTIGLDKANGTHSVRSELYVLQANATVDMDGCVLVARTPVEYTVGL